MSLLAALALRLSGPAVAAEGEAAQDDVELAAVEQRAHALASRASSLEVATRPGSYLTHDEAVIRFQDDLFLELIGEHGTAAEGFYALVTTGALEDVELHRDAEWYLAESLLGLGNTQSAAARFQAIVDDPQHPFRADAVRRLLELYAQTGDREAFAALYAAEIATGKVKPTPLITYSLGKSFYQQGDFGSARATFVQVEPETPWYGRARYFLGVMDVVERNLESARAHFQAAADVPVTTTEERLVHDQALLALGRVAYERGEYLAAAEAYNLIEEDSLYLADKLYEMVWTSIRSQRWHDALNNVEVFLIAFPEHEYAAQLDLLEGHLHFQEQGWDDALGSYEQVIAEYTPVKDRFAVLAVAGPESDTAVHEVLEATEESPPVDLPPYAVAMMRADPALGSAMALFDNLERQRRDLEVSERLITELTGYLEAGGSVGNIETAKAEAIAVRADVIGARLALAAVETEIVVGGKSHEEKLTERRQALETRQHALEAKVLQASAPPGLDASEISELEILHTECASLANDLRAARPGRADDAELARIDDVYATLDTAWDRLGRAAGAAVPAPGDSAELGHIRARLDEEIAAVAVERTEYERTLGEARTVALALTREGFGRLEDFFADAVLNADMGIVDVFWAQKLEVTDELTRIKEEKDALTAELDRRFGLIRDKMGEAP